MPTLSRSLFLWSVIALSACDPGVSGGNPSHFPPSGPETVLADGPLDVDYGAVVALWSGCHDVPGLDFARVLDLDLYPPATLDCIQKASTCEQVRECANDRVEIGTCGFESTCDGSTRVFCSTLGDQRILLQRRACDGPNPGCFATGEGAVCGATWCGFGREPVCDNGVARNCKDGVDRAQVCDRGCAITTDEEGMEQATCLVEESICTTGTVGWTMTGYQGSCQGVDSLVVCRAKRAEVRQSCPAANMCGSEKWRGSEDMLRCGSACVPSCDADETTLHCPGHFSGSFDCAAVGGTCGTPEGSGVARCIVP